MLDDVTDRIPTSVEIVTAFLQAFAREGFCARCLGDKTGILYPVRDDVFFEVARQGHAARSPGTCSACGSRATVLTAEGVF